MRGPTFAARFDVYRNNMLLECEWIGSSPCNIDLTYQPRPLHIDSIIRRMREKEKAGIVCKKKIDEDKCGMWELKCGMNRKANNLRWSFRSGRLRRNVIKNITWDCELWFDSTNQRCKRDVGCFNMYDVDESLTIINRVNHDIGQ